MIRLFVVLGFVMSTASVADAQRVASFPDLPMRLNLGDQVTVREIGGATSHGRLTEITPERLTLRMDSRDVVITRERVREVRACCDSLGNGTLIGLVAGATLGALVARGFSDHPTAGDGATGALIFGAIGAGLGVGIDALIRADIVIYRASAVTIHLVPEPTRRQVRLLVRW